MTARPVASGGAVPNGTAVSAEGLWLGRRAVPLGNLPEAGTDGAEDHVWTIESGMTLDATLRRWAAIAGYSVLPRFTSQEQWRFVVSDSFTGSFEAALTWVTAGFSQAERTPVVRLYANRVLDLLGQPGGRLAGSFEPAGLGPAVPFVARTP